MSSTLMAISQCLFKKKISLCHSTSIASLMAKTLRVDCHTLTFLKNSSISYYYNYLSDLNPIEIPPEKPGKEPPLSPPSPSPDFPSPDMPGPPPEIVPPGGPDVVPPTEPEVVPPGWPDVTPPEIVPPTGPDVVPPKGPEPTA
ncbi:hypothetical protein T459_11066 [Capsicum annuum]|uniref:Uncharacterized protein n=1 Tax=Capsicum annuum TaxID=4072 RepID=A0A2G2ZKX7_CAPAN|nr:hypothetical protein T459_11066 [Capsicum annuum]